MAIRIGFQLPAASSQLTLEAKIQLKKRDKDRMVFPVKSDLALSIGLSAGLGHGRARPSAQMGNRSHWRKQYLEAAHPDGVAEVDVLRVQKEALVEQPRGIGVRAAHEEARAADPVDELFARGLGLDPCGRPALLPEFVEGGHHPAE